MKKLLFLTPVIVIVGYLLLRSGLNKDIPNDSVSTDETSVSAPTSRNANPYSISGLRSRSFSSALKIEETIRTTSKFTSYKVSYDSDGLKLYSLMNIPTGKSPDNGWPVVIVNHGYIEPSVFSTENSYINTSAYYANSGFIVLKPDYRGHDNSEGDAEGLLSRISYAVDVLNLLSAIKVSLPEADDERIYMYGHSMGGDVTLRVIEACADCVRAVSLWAPAVSDWPESFLYFARRDSQNPERKARLERRLKELQENFSESEYPQISTLANVSQIKIPVIVHHGTNDESVPYEWGTKLATALDSAGVKNQFYSYQGDNHDISGNWSTALNRDISFFRQN